MLHAVIRADEFRDAAMWVGRLCPSLHAEVILQGMVIESAGDDVRLSAYDADTAGTATTSAVIRDAGRVLVAGRLMAAIAKTLDPKKDVSLIDDGARLRVTAGRNSWELPKLDLDHYPILPAAADAAARLDPAALRRAVKRILPAADRQPASRLHACVKFVFAGQTLTIVATDGWRLAVAEIEASLSKINSEIDILVPSEFLDATIAVLAPSSSAVEFGVSPGAITLTSPSQSLLGRVGAGKWPLWRQLLPPVPSPVSAIFVVSDLVTALDRATAVLGDDSAIRFSMSRENGFELEALGTSGLASAEAIVSEYVGESKTTGMKPRYLRAALDGLDSDLAVVRTKPASGAGLDFAPLDDNGEVSSEYRHFVMPVDPRKLAAQP